MNNQPLLTIAIPTYNRSVYLAETLKQLQSELKYCAKYVVEILVSDNASPDGTQGVVQDSVDAGLMVRYKRNLGNIGSDANIAQCFNMAYGHYVLILGDDDLFMDHTLLPFLEQLDEGVYGVVCLRPYGFDHDFRKEYPGQVGVAEVYCTPGKFLVGIGPLMTLISSCAINKRLLSGVDANDYCGENLVQVHLVIQAAIKASKNLFDHRYVIACTRNNSGGYDLTKVFVENLGLILDRYIGRGISAEDVHSIEARLIVSYFPFYLLKQRFLKQGKIQETFERLNVRYRGRLIFYFWVFPILKLPRCAALVWGVLATVFGRVLNGDTVRGLKFISNKIRI
jgi:glycosyltransferase involved in cell wall biosynthesis